MSETISAADFRKNYKGHSKERKLQAAVCEELTLMDVYHYAIPNGQMRKGTPKEPGMRAGMPDLHIPISHDTEGTLYIELKRKKPGRRKGKTYTSPDQKKQLNRLTELGHTCCICRSTEEVHTVATYHLSPDGPGVPEALRWPNKR